MKDDKKQSVYTWDLKELRRLAQKVQKHEERVKKEREEECQKLAPQL